MYAGWNRVLLLLLVADLLLGISPGGSLQEGPGVITFPTPGGVLVSM